MKKVLIVGNLYALTKKLAALAEEVFVVPGNKAISEFATCVDIREDKPLEILEFALENDIDLTIVVSEKAIKSDVAGIFQANDKPVFAPTKESANFATSLSYAKRFLYKLRIPTPKFAIFEKLPLAMDYVQSANYPLVISNDNGTKKQCCTIVSVAKSFVEELFSSDEDKIVINDFTYGHEFTLYVITDGYHALPLAIVANFKFTENGDGGRLTNGVGAYVPDNCISEDIVADMFKNVVSRVLDSLEKRGNAYVGIICIDAVLTGENSYSVLGFKPFMTNIDAQAVLNSVDENLIELFEACANGFFADEYDDILLNDNISVSCLVKSRKKGSKIQNIETVESEITYLGAKSDVSVIGDNFVLTSCAKTLSRAKKYLAEDISQLKFDGMKCRSDLYS